MPLVDARGFNLTPDLAGSLSRGLTLGTQFGNLGLNRQLLEQKVASGQQDIEAGQQQFDIRQQGIERGARTQELLGQVLQPGVPQGIPGATPGFNQDQAMAQLFINDPKLAIQVRKELGIRDQSRMDEAARFALDLRSTSFPARPAKINARIQQLGIENSRQTAELLNMDQAKQDEALTAVAIAALPVSEQIKISGGGSLRKPAGQLEFEALIKDFTPKEKKTARRVKAGLRSRAVGSALQTIADEGTVTKIAKVKSMIEGAVVEARIIATDRGETFTELAQAKAGLPGLTSVVNKLKELAPIVTSTIGGKLADTAIKELGFGATKGSTARAKFIGIINNQVLPLLKATFGGSFSVQEGESLKATMGDPDATPNEKLAQLEAFIAQKIRDIEAKELRLKNDAPPPPPGFVLEGQ